MVCARCQRLKLECKIESSFKRVGKRSKNAEMEREIIELKRQLASSHAHTPSVEHQPSSQFSNRASVAQSPHVYQQSQQHSGQFELESDEAVASLLDLKQGLDGGGAGYLLKGQQAAIMNIRKLGPVAVMEDRAKELFDQ